MNRGILVAVVLAVILVIGATYRATRLVVADDFPFGPIRARIAERALVSRRAAWLDDLVTCAWCTSVWLAAGITALTWWLRDGGLPSPVLVAATASGATGLLTKLEAL